MPGRRGSTTVPEERDEIRAIVEERCADIPDEDLHVLGYHEWVDGLERGLAAHHAGMLPTFKEVVEELFVRGLVRAVFATETLALGINMPARSVVIERLVKWNGETHAEITPGVHPAHRPGGPGYRRRGTWRRALAARTRSDGSGRFASTRTYPLRSSFRPSYNMAVNLVGQVGRARARSSWSPRSPSSRPTGPSWPWPARCAGTRRHSTGIARR